MAKSPSEATARTSANNEWFSPNAGISFLRRIDNQRSRNTRVFLLRDGPGVPETLPGGICSYLYDSRIKRIGRDGKSAPHCIQEFSQRLRAGFGIRPAQFRWRSLKRFVVSCQFLEGNIMSFQQPQFFKVRIRETPTPALIAPDPVSQDAR